MNWLKRIAALLAGRRSTEIDGGAAMLRGLLDSAPDAMVVVDRSGRVVLINAQAERMFGYTRAELLGRPVELLLPIDSRARHQGHVTDFMAAPHVRPMGEAAALRGRRRDGSEFPIEVSLGPFRAGEELLVSSAIRDVTLRRQAEAELEQARSKAQAASRAKSDFLASMSHELRTPLNAVLGFGEMLQLDLDHTLTAKQQEYVGHILEAGQHLLTLVNEVLDLSGIEAGHLRMSIEPVPVADALEEVGATMRPLADQAGLRFAVGRAERVGAVRADRVRLHQILLNLVANAIKYNRAGGTVTVSAHAVKPGRVRFEVTDTGIGISAEEQASLFQPFQRLDAGRERAEGFGIGLALSRKLVETLGGEIGCSSTPGQGSTFWFELARAPAASAAQTYSLLYIESNPSSIRLMEDLLGTLPGVEMIAAPTAQLGLDLAVAHRPDVIVLDLNMPGMDGIALLGRLKARPETRSIPVLALTGAVLPQDVERIRAAEFFRHIVKPFDVKTFLAAIDDALATARPSASPPPALQAPEGG